MLSDVAMDQPAARRGDSAEAAGYEHLDRWSDPALVRRPLGCFESALSSEARPRSCTNPTATAGSRSPPSGSDHKHLQQHKHLQRHQGSTPRFIGQRRALTASHPLTRTFFTVVLRHLHLLLPPDPHDLLAVGVPQLLKHIARASDCC